ncbi:MAG: hypothetical protein H7244_08600 [Herminiimonas sp.]|nr:hypothetical protein [Herminiimonas sp.]
MLTITIKQGKGKSLLQGDCLIYLSAIDKVDGKPGERMQGDATARAAAPPRQPTAAKPPPRPI